VTSSRLVAGSILVLLSACGFVWAKDHKTVVNQNTAPGVAYTGSVSCSGCHADLDRSFHLTPMGHSMAPANAPSELAKVPSRITVYNQELDRYFQVVREGSDIYQT